MPGQYINQIFSKPIMTILRCAWSVLYLWIMMHGASIMIVINERWEEGLIWNKRLPDELIYWDELANVSGAEMLTWAMIVSVLVSIYVSSQPVGGVRVRNEKRLEKIVLCTPYVFAFLVRWLFTTFVTVSQLMGQPRDASWNRFAQFTFALLFKILIMANMSSVCLRAYVKLFGLEVERNIVRISNLNFGDRLSQIFLN
ncbi:uncharacterized protein [Drosophila kikkawai]|uniref:Uncharacterized protein n=1 Tax=Drosophila kikkawai TaxID=30033 RepID=A0A6P4I8X3_DROKI|nr:uncharacterized protein LOC108072415 [Drosophila kikkawai]